MVLSLLWEIQKATYTALTGDASLMTIVSNRVFDSPPANTDFPYVIVGDAQEGAWNRLGNNGQEATIDVSVWSKYRGFKEALSAAERIVAALAGQSMTLTGFNHVYTWHEDTETSRDPDDETRRVVVGFRVLASES